MGRSPCCDEKGLKKGPWTPEEDQMLIQYINEHGHRSWRALPQLAGLRRCGKSCRLRWTNYLKPDIKRGKFSQDEENTILHLHSILGNKWSAIARNLPGRTDNEIKNFWNTHLKKKLIQMGFDPMTHQPRTELFSCLPQLIALAKLNDLIDHHHQFESIQLAKLQCLNNITEIAAISNLMDSVPQIHENLNSSQLEVRLENPNYQFSMEKENTAATISQPLHQIVPFGIFQTTLDSEMRQLGHNVNSSTSSSSWSTLPSLTSSDFSPLSADTLMGNPGHISSAIFHRGGLRGGASSDWPEFNFEESFLHDDRSDVY